MPYLKSITSIQPCFNSMKVRLKLSRVCACLLRTFGFNSMKVRLKHLEHHQIIMMMKKFQFHEGPIKTLTLLTPLVPMSCFNSMKVRLKPCAASSSAFFLSCFNSMKVRLKLRRGSRLGDQNEVSIP